ncbi:amidotransferase 1, exosortase A system-associated [Herbaspirillum seropedicae]|uniref:asparagine synthase (glutamine-hydrolyzing) n=1 Tax=Herbaspirillum seropedicae (strain SmR1) TaxID=757424 RepID=D8IYR0_HERSS|nr:XrtA/PEP-CTERM system amidotransferase [Herbaspirillum seropedicae]ADJ64245.1 asparagine synthase (glutamine-hydrolyzing) protein [Herbaspirillum seropedicae SmR1]AKN66196.1 asparagine synthase [Herbaspirillum seropedicae]NQE30717.1 asparagine synthase [Herbaspirillum seropedicae]UMU22188.1 amidotransferase 1, exosortase A system-associated [Herbaspirillum seropedicae]
MCGITGIFSLHGQAEIDRQLLARMNETQHHRGPDEGGLHVEAGLGLGHRRLSIVDLSSGQQPLFNEDGSVVVVFNGMIYNYRELMRELTALGHQFRSRCDTEVIVHAWEQWGRDCVTRLRGMFAFALWDRQRQTLFVARDRLGIKPLFYALLPDGRFLFASELKALLADPALPRALDPCAVEEYFAYGYVPEPRTILRGVHKLSPGHTLLLQRGATRGQPQQQRYWDIPFQLGSQRPAEEIAAELLERLREVVGSHLVTDVSLGGFLSGGVDSSAVVAMMAQLTGESVNTCSIAFNDPAYDESHYAAQVAQQFRTRHHMRTVDKDDYGLIDLLAKLYDEPYADSSAIPTYRVCQLAKESVTVALSGDGGDENFAGYRRYRYAMNEEKVRARLPEGLRKPLFGFLGRHYPKADWAPRVLRAKTTFEALARDTVEGYFHGVSIMPDRVRQRLLSPGLRRELQGYQAIEVMRGHAAQAPTEDALSLLQYLDLKTYLPGDILTKVDRASMAHALEVRVPLLDHQFVEWVSGLPPALKLHEGQGKYIFKKALEGTLSEDILYRRKMGFSIPLSSWLRGPLRQVVQDSLLGPLLRQTGLFDMDFVQELVEQHQSGRRDHAAPLWALLMFAAFLRNVLQAGAGAAPQQPAARAA